MKFIRKKPVSIAVLAGICGIAGIIVLAVFPLHAAFSVWKGYRVLVVSPAENEKEIVTRLDKAGIGDYATESNSRLGDNTPETPVEPFIASVNKARSAWFVNPEHDLRYFFIKDASFLDRKVQKALSDSGIFWYLEETGGFTPIPCFLALLLLAAGLICAGNRIYQIACAIPFILLTLSYNRPAGFLSAIFALIAVIFTAGILDLHALQLTSTQIKRRLRKYGLFFIPVPLAILIVFADGPHACILVAAAFFASAAALVPAQIAISSFHSFRETKRMHPRFIPAVMHPQTITGYRKGRFFPAVPLAALVLSVTGILVFSFGTSPDKKRHTGRELYIPAPSGYTRHTGFDLEGYTELVSARSGAALPDLGDFIAAQWNIRTYPWRRLQVPLNNPASGSSVDYVWYSVDRNGIISGKTKTLYTFDTGFIRKTLSSDSSQLEKLLIRQNRYVTVNLTRLQ